MMVRRRAAVVVVLCTWFIARIRSRSRPSVSYAPMSARDEERQSNLSYIYNSSDTQFVELLRMRRAPFYQMCDLFRSRELLKGTIHCTIEEQVAMFLHVVGHNQRFSCTKFSFRRSTETISRHFQEVLYAVGELRNELIVVPSSSVPSKIWNSRRWYPYLKVSTNIPTGPML